MMEQNDTYGPTDLASEIDEIVQTRGDDADEFKDRIKRACNTARAHGLTESQIRAQLGAKADAMQRALENEEWIPMTELTTIQVTQEQKAELDSLKAEGQSYKGILWELIENYNQDQTNDMAREIAEMVSSDVDATLSKRLDELRGL